MGVGWECLLLIFVFPFSGRYKNGEDAKKALVQLNGVELANMKVGSRFVFFATTLGRRRVRAPAKASAWTREKCISKKQNLGFF